MILEVKKWPESQDVMNKKGWFFITGSKYFDNDDLTDIDLIGNAAYARVLDESEYILVEKTTADKLNELKEENEYESEKFWNENPDPKKEYISKITGEEIITYGDKKLRDYGPPYGPHNPAGNEPKKGVTFDANAKDKKPPNCS